MADSSTSRWTSVAAQVGAAVLAGLAALELLSDGSRGAHLLGPLRWPGFGAAVIAALLGLAGGLRDAVREAPPARRVFRDVFTLAVLAVAAQVLLSASFKVFLCTLSFGLAGGALAALRLGDRAADRARKTRWGRLLELTMFQLCLALVLLETGLRLVAIIVPSPLFAREAQQVDDAIAMYRYRPGALRFGFPCNAGGHYDEEFAPGERTVASIGDSFSAGIVPHGYHFTTVCERELAGTAVHNLGHAALGPGAYLRLLEEQGVALQPDIVLINLFVGNDLSEATRWNNPRGFLRSVCDRRNVLAYPLPTRLWKLMREQQRPGVAPHGPGLVRGEERLTEPTSDEAELIRAFPWLADPALEQPSLLEEEFLRVEAERAESIHLADRHGYYQALFAALEEMRETVGAIPLVVMLIPDQFQVDEALWREVCECLGRSDLDRDQPQRRIAAWLDQRGIPYLDLLPVLRAVERLPDGDRHLYHLRDTHFNARGNEHAGRTLARFLAELK